MRKIIVISMTTLDGVMQAPGGPEEDTANEFKFGGWTSPYGDKEFAKALEKQLQQTDYLLGRRTFEIWEAYWPKHAEFWPGINEGTKYVLSNTRDKTDWENTKFIKNVEAIEQLKQTDGADLQVWGSSRLIQLLLKHDLVDELQLKIFPLTLGNGKKLFEEGAIPAAFILLDCTATASGVILANYARAGDVKTGSVEA